MADETGERQAEDALRKMASEVGDPLGGVLRSLFGMIDRERARVADVERALLDAAGVVSERGQEWDMTPTTRALVVELRSHMLASVDSSSPSMHAAIVNLIAAGESLRQRLPADAQAWAARWDEAVAKARRDNADVAF